MFNGQTPGAHHTQNHQSIYTPAQVAEGPLRNILTEAAGLVYGRMSAVMDQAQLFDHLQLSLSGSNTAFVWTGAGFTTAKLAVFR